MMHATRSSEGDFVTFRVGGIEVTAISDGILGVPIGNFPAATPEAASRFVTDPERVPVQVNAFLVHGVDGPVLIDAGCGEAAAPSGSRILANLKASGANPSDIRTVVLSHLHVDHAGGLLEAGEPVFAGARILVPEAELQYWLQPGFPDAAPERQKKSALVVQEVMRAYSGAIDSFAPGEDVATGITSVPLAGHTPGHCGFVVGDGAASLFIWGDIVHSAALQFARPDWFYAADVDRDTALGHRRALLRACAADGRPIAGMHLPFPGVGTVAGDETGYRFVPAAY